RPDGSSTGSLPVRSCSRWRRGEPSSRCWGTDRTSRLDPRLTASIEFGPMTTRVSTGLDRLDQMLGGGLLPGTLPVVYGAPGVGLLAGTLTVVYGATGIGKTHLGLVFAHRGLAEDGAPGVLFDMNARGDSQQHHAYAERLYGWTLGRWTHTVTPMAEPHPSDE